LEDETFVELLLPLLLYGERAALEVEFEKHRREANARCDFGMACERIMVENETNRSKKAALDNRIEWRFSTQRAKFS
jgi:hypothetical protein